MKTWSKDIVLIILYFWGGKGGGGVISFYCNRIACSIYCVYTEYCLEQFEGEQIYVYLTKN